MVHPVEHLTPREAQILQCFANGLGRKDVAAELGISLVGLKSHMTNIDVKFAVNNEVGAIVAAAKRGLVVLDPIGEDS
jgi:DNA-binding CsgD family transcriptional regulator